MIYKTVCFDILNFYLFMSMFGSLKWTVKFTKLTAFGRIGFFALNNVLRAKKGLERFLLCMEKVQCIKISRTVDNENFDIKEDHTVVDKLRSMKSD